MGDAIQYCNGCETNQMCHIERKCMRENLMLSQHVGSMCILQSVQLDLPDEKCVPNIIGCFSDEDAADAWLMEKYPKAKYENRGSAMYARCKQSKLGFILIETDLFSL